MEPDSVMLDDTPPYSPAPMDRLPDEVLIKIINQLYVTPGEPWRIHSSWMGNQRHLASAMRVSKRFHRLSAPVLYDTVIIRDYPAFAFGLPDLEDDPHQPTVTKSSTNVLSKADCLRFTCRIFFKDPPWGNTPRHDAVKNASGHDTWPDLHPYQHQWHTIRIALSTAWMYDNAPAIEAAIRKLNLAFTPSDEPRRTSLKAISIGAYSRVNEDRKSLCVGRHSLSSAAQGTAEMLQSLIYSSKVDTVCYDEASMYLFSKAWRGRYGPAPYPQTVSPTTRFIAHGCGARAPEYAAHTVHLRVPWGIWKCETMNMQVILHCHNRYQWREIRIEIPYNASVATAPNIKRHMSFLLGWDTTNDGEVDEAKWIAAWKAWADRTVIELKSAGFERVITVSLQKGSCECCGGRTKFER